MQTLVITKDMRGDIPYSDNSVQWHCWIDICQAVKNHANEGSIVSVQRLMESNGLDIAYYENGLSSLLADGFITVLE